MAQAIDIRFLIEGSKAQAEFLADDLLADIQALVERSYPEINPYPEKR